MKSHQLPRFRCALCHHTCHSLGKLLNLSESFCFCKQYRGRFPILLTLWGYCDREMRNFKRKPHTFTNLSVVILFIGEEESKSKRENLSLVFIYSPWNNSFSFHVSRFPIFFAGECTLGIWTCPRQGTNQNYSCWPMPQPQQCGILAASVSYTTAHGNAGSFTH